MATLRRIGLVAGALAAATLLTTGAGATGLFPVLALHTYDEEDLGHQAEVGDYYDGVTYNAGTVVMCAPNYNDEAFPPSSEPCLSYNPTGVVTLALDGPIAHFSADFVTAGVTEVTITGFDAHGTVVIQTTGCTSEYGEYERCGITDLGGLIVSIELTGGAGLWGMDTSLFSVLPLPVL